MENLSAFLGVLIVFLVVFPPESSKQYRQNPKSDREIYRKSGSGDETLEVLSR
jgi:hypothetical protein